MDLQEEILSTVEDAVTEALDSAHAEWSKSPWLTKAGRLTDKRVHASGGNVTGTLTFEVPDDTPIPVTQRDQYGVVGKTRGITPGIEKHSGSRVSVPILMQKMENTLETTFTGAMDTPNTGGTT